MENGPRFKFMYQKFVVFTKSEYLSKGPLKERSLLLLPIITTIDRNNS